MLAGKTVFHLCPRAAPSLDACRLPRHRVSRAPPQPGKPRYPAGTAPRGRSGSALQSATASCLCPLRAWHPALAPALSCRRYSHRQIHCTTRMRLLIIHGMFNGGILSQHGRAHPSPHILSHLHILCICLCQSPAVHYVLRGNPRKSGAPCEIQVHAHQLTGDSQWYRRLVRARAAHLTYSLDPRKRYPVRAGSVSA